MAIKEQVETYTGSYKQLLLKKYPYELKQNITTITQIQSGIKVLFPAVAISEYHGNKNLSWEIPFQSFTFKAS